MKRLPIILSAVLLGFALLSWPSISQAYGWYYNGGYYGGYYGWGYYGGYWGYWPFFWGSAVLGWPYASYAGWPYTWWLYYPPAYSGPE